MDDAARLALLWDRTAIHDVMLRFGRALDTHDWPLYRSCFQDEIEVDFEDLTGMKARRVTADLWTDFARAALSPLKVHHTYANHLITVTGDEAEGVLYHNSRHRRATDRGSDTNYQFGWYENRYRRAGDGWLISRLCHRIHWIDGNDRLLDHSADPEFGRLAALVFGG